MPPSWVGGAPRRPAEIIIPIFPTLTAFGFLEKRTINCSNSSQDGKSRITKSKGRKKLIN